MTDNEAADRLKYLDDVIVDSAKGARLWCGHRRLPGAMDILQVARDAKQERKALIARLIANRRGY